VAYGGSTPEHSGAEPSKSRRDIGGQTAQESQAVIAGKPTGFCFRSRDGRSFRRGGRHGDVRSVCDRAKSPHPAICRILADGAAELGCPSGRSGPWDVQGFSALRARRSQRGTQDSNLESPVLETGGFPTRHC
jgi:hypothetical protein